MISIAIKDFCRALQLEMLNSGEITRDSMEITVPDLNRPGLQFTGFYDYFANNRVQILGKVETAYLRSMDPETRRNSLIAYFKYKMPCVIVCWGMKLPEPFVELASEANVPVMVSPRETTQLSIKLINYLRRQLAEHTCQHGVLVDVYGIGVLLTGDSGVGKSEAALELIKRGHQLVADDVVDICRVAEDRLVGESPETVRYFMEIRGIGIIDIRAMYGISAVMRSKNIDMVIHLERWENGKEYDRLGLQEDTIKILNVELPYQVMPVKPGRNLAVVIEVAARNMSLKRMGISALQELDRRMKEQYSRSDDAAGEFEMF